jgi:hypothetical protein
MYHVKQRFPWYDRYAEKRGFRLAPPTAAARRICTRRQYAVLVSDIFNGTAYWFYPQKFEGLFLKRKDA